MNRKQYEETCNNIIMILITIEVVMVILLIFFYPESSMNQWRETSEGICFKGFAIIFCEEHNMEFEKLYHWGCDYDFRCSLRGRYKDYDFNREEKFKCGDYYGS